MGNEILTKLANGQMQGNPLSNIVALSRDFRNAKNPQEFIANRLANNPKVQEAVQYINKFPNIKEAYYSLAKERGVDGDQFLNNFR